MWTVMRRLNNIRPSSSSVGVLVKKFATYQQSRDTEKETHFGYEQIKESEKQERVRQVFEEVASGYDLMNDVSSLGVHRIWKDIFMHRLSPTPTTRLLDVAGGTGDIAFRFLKYAANQDKKAKPHVTVYDINANMLEVGKTRARDLGFNSDVIAWKQGNAESLSYESDSFDAYTISFGIRNCTHIDKVLEEAYRVLKPGGRFLCLEFSTLENSLAQWLYDAYSFQLIPVIGQLVTGKPQHYKYLVESIRRFPDQETFKAMIEAAGFRLVTYENLNMGIVSIHSGFKL